MNFSSFFVFFHVSYSAMLVPLFSCLYMVMVVMMMKMLAMMMKMLAMMMMVVGLPRLSCIALLAWSHIIVALHCCPLWRRCAAIAPLLIVPPTIVQHAALVLWLRGDFWWERTFYWYASTHEMMIWGNLKTKQHHLCKYTYASYREMMMACPDISYVEEQSKDQQ